MSSFMRRLLDLQPSRKKQRRTLHLDCSSNQMAFITQSSTTTQYLCAPQALTSKRAQHALQRRNDVDDFLSSDLELSFASTMSLYSPPRETVALAAEHENDVPMDISPPPKPTSAPAFKENGGFLKPVTRPRAFTSAARMFGRDLSNNVANEPAPSITKSISTKRIQRSALPSEWFAPTRSSENQSNENIFAPPLDEPFIPSSDAMDIDSVESAGLHHLQSGPCSSVPTGSVFDTYFHEGMPPLRAEDSPAGPLSKKRRSLSPDSTRIAHIDPDLPSSPAPSSPSQHKLERMRSGPLLSQGLQGNGSAPLNPGKRARRPALSAMIQPTEAATIQSAYPTLGSGPSPLGELRNKIPPVRRAFSAMLPPTALEGLSDESSSFDGPDLSSPAQAYIQRQQVKTIRRRDGTEDFRPLTAGLNAVQKDTLESPSSRFLNAGMPGFGDNEALGKILPCHRVREDGLMRIVPDTLDALLDGLFDDKINEYHIIDCRFDYEYNGGHVPKAVNVNTTAAVEEYFLGSAKPKPCVSGDITKKTILVFHCEFSAKRAPTFAKHLRSRDRALNNHVYPKIHYPEVYILEGGYCEYFKRSATRCQPQGYVTMDDPVHALSRREDLDQFRKAKFGRTKSYAYGELGGMKITSAAQQPKRNTAPSTVGASQLFAAANAARTRRGNGGLSTLAEHSPSTMPTDDEDTDIGDSPCPPPNKASLLSKAKKLHRAPLGRSETYGPNRMAY